MDSRTRLDSVNWDEDVSKDRTRRFPDVMPLSCQ